MVEKRAILLLKIPQNNNKKEDAAEAFFTQVAEILKGKKVTLSAEIAIFGKYLWFFLTCPDYVKDMIKGQWNSFYPLSEIEQIKDYAEKVFGQAGIQSLGCELYLERSELIPLKTYRQVEKNPLVSLSGIATSFAQDESGFIQLVLEPPAKDTQWRKFVRTVKRSRLKEAGAEQKKESTCYKTTLRFLASGSSLGRIQLNLSSMMTVYRKSLEDESQKLKEGAYKKDWRFFEAYKSRVLAKSFTPWKKPVFKFAPQEIATFFHLPHQEEEISQIVQVRSKKAPPPQNLPLAGKENKEMAPFGETNFQNVKVNFGIKTSDRRRHLYIAGKSGTGKTKLLELLISSDLQAGRGVIFLDPHGDSAKEILNFIPESRIKDVVYFDPTDLEYPIGFNPMEGVGEFEFKQNIVSGFIAIFKKLFGLNWNERFEHVLRYTTLALLEYPSASVMAIPRMLTDNLFRQEVISYISDPLVKKFWTTEFAAWNEQFASQAIVPIINKIGQFVANPMIRNIVGQAKTGFSLEEIMNKEKIFIANLPIGKLGEENSALLGSMLVTKIWQTAMARTSIPEENRKDCFFYVDEFQNFATTAFANVLSEARKYRLDLTIAHQYIQQLPDEVRATIFGNVGNLIAFRVGGEDAQILVKEFEPVFSVNDFLNLDIRNFLIKMSVDGQTSQPFSAVTITLNRPPVNKVQKIINSSRRQWAKTRSQVEKEIREWESGKLPKKAGTRSSPPIGEFFPEPII